MLDLARERVIGRDDTRLVVLSLEESPDLDSTSLEALTDDSVWLQARHITLRVAHLKDAVRRLLQRAALPQLAPTELDFWSVEDAAVAPLSKVPA